MLAYWLTPLLRDSVRGKAQLVILPVSKVVLTSSQKAFKLGQFTTLSA